MNINHNYPFHNVLETNIESIKDKIDIFCYTEEHDNNNQKINISKLIAKNYRSEDIVLIEGAEGNLSPRLAQYILIEYPLLTPKMHIKGWDSNQGLDIPDPIIKKMNKVSDKLEEMQNLGCDSQEFKDTLNSVIELSGISQDLLNPEFQTLSQSEIYNESHHKDIKSILKKCSKYMIKQFSDLMNTDSLLIRNKAMAAAITANLRVGQNRLHIIAGDSHFIQEFSKEINKSTEKTQPSIEKRNEYREINRRCIEVLRFVMEKHKFVILKPKDSVERTFRQKVASTALSILSCVTCPIWILPCLVGVLISRCSSSTSERNVRPQPKWATGSAIDRVHYLSKNFQFHCDHQQVIIQINE